MRQVPQKLNAPKLVGGGRLARHLSFYFEQNSIGFTSWCRPKNKESLSSSSFQDWVKKLNSNDLVLLAISDDSLKELISQIRKHSNCTILHFSGSLFFKDAIGAHPLMTFTHDKTYEKAEYENIPFVVDQRDLKMDDLIPGIKNPTYYINPQEKNLYHSFCMMSCNFPMIIWQQIFRHFKERLGLPPEILFPILKRSLKNSTSGGENILTGPLSRGDQSVIKNNIVALADSPEEKLFQSFCQYYLASQNTSQRSSK